MKYEEKECDLFSYYDKGYYLVHCISADFKLGAGIAKEFDKRFDIRYDLLYFYGEKWYEDYADRFPGCVFYHKKKRIIDLVTKERYWHKPTNYSMLKSLEKLKDGCICFNITKIAMPKIGCGLDKLKWEDVSSMIQKIFSDTDIEIVVCYL